MTQLKIKTKNFEYYHNPKTKGFFLINDNSGKRKELINKLLDDKIDLKNCFNENVSKNTIKNSFFNTYAITFEVTERCNLQCEYCACGKYYTRKNMDRTSNDLKTEHAIKFLKYFFDNAKSRTKRLNIGFYGGEPLLNMDIIKDIISYIKSEKLNYNISFSLTTNVLLLKKNIDFFVENKFRLYLSLDGDKDANSYRFDEKIFNRILDDIIFIKNKYPDYYNEYINFNSVLHNKNSIDNVHKYFKEILGKIPILSNVSKNGLNTSYEAEFKEITNINPIEYNNCNKEIQDDYFTQFPEISGLDKFLRNTSGIIYENIDCLMNEPVFSDKIPTATCIPFSSKIFITAQGKMIPCEQISHEYSFYQITDDDIVIDFERIVEKYNKMLNRIKTKCISCFNSFNCSQCVFVMEWKENTVCDKHLNPQKYANKISEYIDILENDERLLEKIVYE